MFDKKWINNYINNFKNNVVYDQNDLRFKYIKIRNHIFESRKNNGILYFCGNGASNTIASHSSLDFSNMLGMRCFSFNDPSIITAYSNDFEYEKSIIRYVKLFLKENDILFLISSSGESKNIINACKEANNQNIITISFTGFNQNNSLSQISDINIWVNSNIYNIVESSHYFLLAMLCDYLIKDEKDKIGKHGVIL